MWGYGAWNNWEKEERSTEEIAVRLHKEGSGTYGLRRQDVYDLEKWWEGIKEKFANPSQSQCSLEFITTFNDYNSSSCSAFVHADVNIHKYAECL